MPTIITDPPAEASLVGVDFDHRTTGGLYLPHEENSARIDVRRLRATILLLDGMVSGLPTTIGAALADIVGTAPAALDTLQEISAALKNNPAVIDEILTALGLRATKAELATVVTSLTALIGQKASASDHTALGVRVGALETIAPSRARLIARAIAYSGVR